MYLQVVGHRAANDFQPGNQQSLSQPEERVRLSGWNRTRRFADIELNVFGTQDIIFKSTNG